MQTLKISDFSREAASQSKGMMLKELMEPFLKAGEEFAIDFDEITRFASPFFNNSFANLALIYGFPTIEKIAILNISEVGKLAYDTSINNAKLLSQNPEFADKIHAISNDNTPKKDD